MLKKLICISVCLLLVLGLCGCDFVTADTAELLSPPSLSGDIKPISQVIEDTAPDGYVMKYPSRGNYRSAVIREDVNSDGILESFAFYSVTDGDVITMHMNVICNRDGKWVSVADQQIVAAGVDKIEFCDLDEDGTEEILVGWQIYGTSEMQLGVYSIGENSVTQRMLQKYTHFICCNLDEDGRNEVLILRVSATEPNMAALYALNDAGLEEISSCEIDRTVNAVNEPIIDTLSTGKPAVYVDIIKGMGAVTEVLFFEKGKLVNPLFDPEMGENFATLRSVTFGLKDINEDGILEIPVQMDVPSVAHTNVNEKLYLTNWCSFNGETLTNQMTTMINVNDGYYFVLSPKWVGNIAVFKNTTSRVREIYLYNSKKMKLGSSLIYIMAVDKGEWDKGNYRNYNAMEILNDGKTSYICRISDVAIKQGLDIEYVRANFKLLS